MANFNTGDKRYINRGLYITSTNTLIKKEPNSPGTNHIADVTDTTMCPLTVAIPAHPTGIAAVEFAPDSCGTYIRITWIETTGATYYRVIATIDTVETDYVQTGGTSIDLPFSGSSCTEVKVAACNQQGCSIYQPLTVNISNSITTAPVTPESFDVEIYDEGNDHFTCIGSWKDTNCALYYEYAGHLSFEQITIQDTISDFYTGVSAGISTSSIQPRVRACNSFGCSSWVIFGDANRYPPNRPTATFINISGFTLSWNAPYAPNYSVTGYKVYRNGSLYSTEGVSTLSIVITGESNYSTAKWTVAATLSGTSDSPQSAYVSVTLYQSDATPPTAPKNLFSQNIENTEFKLYWTASTDNVEVASYKIFLDGTLYEAINGSYTNRLIIGLTKNTTYAVTMQAIDTSGNTSILSASLSVTTLNLIAGIPDPPTGLSSSNITNTTFDLSWNTPGDDGGSAITGYRIFKGAVQFAAVGVINSYNITGQTANATNDWSLKAVNANGDSVLSSVLSVTQTNHAGFTSYESTSNSSGTGCTSVMDSVRWHDGAGATPVDGDIIYNSDTTGDIYLGGDAEKADEGRNHYKISDLGVVSASGACGADGTAPLTPTDLAVDNMTTTSFRLHWTSNGDNVGITGHNIYKDSVLHADTATDDAFYAVSGLSSSDDSLWEVEAYDAAGNKSAKVGLDVKVGRKSVQISTTSSSTSSGACSLSTAETKYFEGSLPAPDINDHIYENLSGSTLFNGGNNYWKFTDNGSSSKIDGLGKVIDSVIC